MVIVYEDFGFEFVRWVGVNDYFIIGFDFYGFGDVIKLFVILSDGIFIVVSDVLMCMVV